MIQHYSALCFSVIKQLMLTFMLGQSLPKLIHEIQCVKVFDKHK